MSKRHGKSVAEAGGGAVMNAPVAIVEPADLDHVRADMNVIAAKIDEARALFNEGDALAAKMLASGSYDQAKALAQFARRVKALGWLEKCRRMQGAALHIETLAKIQLAREWDAAQAAGAAAKQGRPKKNVPDGNVFTSAEAGISRKEILEGRRLAAAEARQPGIVERAIRARLEAGLEPSRANLRVAIGTASTSDEERGNNLYQTPPEAMRTLLALERFAPVVWEPSCGKGAIVRELEAAGYQVRLSDLVDYGTADRHGEVQEVIDFLETAARDGDCDIVTNPPYGRVLNAYVAHALRVHRPRKMALLLNLNFLCGCEDPDRAYVLDEVKPRRVYVFTRRLPMMHRDGWDGPVASSRMNTAWFVWERDAAGGYGEETVVRRVDWADYQLEGGRG